MRADLTALWRGLVAGLLFVIAAHALEESYATGLLGAAIYAPMSPAEQATIEREAALDVEAAQ